MKTLQQMEKLRISEQCLNLPQCFQKNASEALKGVYIWERVKRVTNKRNTSLTLSLIQQF